MSAARQLGRYALGKRIGAGGVAEVHEATVTGADGFAKKVVIKRLKPELADTPGLVESLRGEADIARRLSHGNVVQVLDFGRDDDDIPYLVMEYVDGCTLRELCQSLAARGETLPLGDAVRVVEEVARALHYVHTLTDESGTPLELVHRDVTPNNILLSRTGSVKLTDFGIAKATIQGSETLPGMIKGTPLYLSPEQATGRPLDARTDIYALGLVLAELVEPHADPTLAGAAARATEPAVRDRFPDIDAFAEALHQWRLSSRERTGPDSLGRLVRRARDEPEPKRARSLDAALLSVSDHDRTRVHVDGPPTAAPLAAGRRRWLLGGLAAAAASAVAWVLVGSSRPARTSPPPPARGPIPSEPEPEPEPADPTPSVPEPERALEVQPDPAKVESPEPVPVDAPESAAPERRAKGRLLVNVLPYALVSVDGKPLGRTPVDAEVAAGRHRLELHNPDTGVTTSRRIRVKAGATTQVTAWE